MRAALAAATTGGTAGAGSGAGGNSEALREMIANLESAKAASWEEKQRLSAAFEAERARVLASEAMVWGGGRGVR